ncbi:tape measure protein [Chryseobacterium sediminis]|uniref:Tape measure protein n=1 Tax=Chryseobacterium sediminis TaxID=1679494 RepID=A0A5B2U937_9FLAO|nr:tape measure protein [Chryseobacterium sediminis]KAA2223052.1 tape measure protein [Chryseobacterium sediminis]
MNNVGGALNFNATLNLNEWRRNVDQIRRDILGLNRQTQQQTSQMDTAFRNLSIGVASYFSAGLLKDFTMQLINVRGEFQKTEVAFATMLGDGDKAKDLMQEMVELAARTPFSLQDVSQGAKQLLAFQVPANEVLDTLTRMGNIASGLSVPISRINLVFGQVRAKGRLMGDDLRQFTEAGIPMVAELAKKFNKTTAEISDMVTEGKIGFKDVKDVLFSLTDEGGMFFNLMEKQSATLSGRISNLGDEFSQMLNKIGQNQEGLLSSGIDGVTNLIEHYQDISNVLIVLISTYGAYRAALIATVAIQRASIIAGNVQAFLQLASSIRSARDAQILFNTVTKANPYVIAATAIAALSAALYVYYNRVSEAERAQQELNAEISKQQAPIAATKTKIDSLVSAIKQENVSNSQRAEWLRQIKVLSNGRLNQLTVEEIRTNKASNAINAYIKQLQKEAEAKAYLTRITDYTEKREQLRAKLKTKLTAGDLLDDLTDFNTVTHDKTGKLLTTLERRNIRTINEINAQSGEIQKAKDKVERLTKEYTNTSGVDPVADTTKIEESAKKTTRELAEIYSLNSIADLEQRIDLWNEALKKASGDTVNVLDKNKFGDVVKTGKTVSVSEAVAEVTKLEEARAKREKEIQVQSFQERISEAERQWNNYYKMAEFYGKETADAQYSALFNGAKNYLDYLEKQEKALVKLSDKSLLSNQQKQDLVFIREKINGLKGLDTPLENIKKGIENTLKSIPSLVDQLEFIEKLKSVNKIGKDNNPEQFFEKDRYYKGLSDGLLQQQQDLYIQFQREHETFEQKKTEITQRYDDIRKRIQESNASDLEKTRQTEEANKAQAKDISSMSFELFQKTDAYVKAFGDLEKVGPRTLKKLRDQFKAFIDSDGGRALGIQDTKALLEVYEKLDNAVKNKNPFDAIGIAIEKYKKKREELNKIEKESGKDSEAYQLKLDDTKSSFEEIVDVSYDATKKMIGYFSGITEAVGGMSDELRSTINDVEQLVEGVYNVFKGFYGNKGQMITGLIQVVGALSKIMNGDNKKEAEIKGWQRDIENLKFLYEQLNKEIEKTAGEASLKKYQELIANLKKQQALLNDMRTKESEKKNPDVDKVNSYGDQIRQISVQIQELVDTFKKTITTVEFKDLSDKLADALTNAFAEGEDAAQSFEKVVDEVMRNAVQNALKMKFLDDAAQKMVDQLYSSMGFGNSSTSAVQNEISKVEGNLKEIEEKLKTVGLQEKIFLENVQKEQLEKLKLLQQQLSEIYANGSFDGLSAEERDKIKAMGEEAMKKYMDALKQYQDLFGQSADNAQGLKGDIKGITEKTAGALEGQINAMRIMQAEALKRSKDNLEVMRSQLLVQSQIEMNTRPLKGIYDEIKSMNSKIKNSLAGIP